MLRPELRPEPCPTCSGPSRETVGMVCQTCGTDYGRPEAPTLTEAERLTKAIAERDALVKSMQSEAGRRIGMRRDALITSLQQTAEAAIEARDAALAERDALAAQIARVQALHTEHVEADLNWCVADGRTWPCPTVEALSPAEATEGGEGA